MTQYVRFPVLPGPGARPTVAEYLLEVDPAGLATRELGLSAGGEVVYRFAASEHRYLVGEFYENPILVPGVHSQSRMDLTMEELSARLIEPAEFERLWTRPGRSDAAGVTTAPSRTGSWWTRILRRDRTRSGTSAADRERDEKDR